MTKVQIPPVLRTATGGARTVEASGATLEGILQDLYAQYPPLGEQLRAESGLSAFVNFYVNGEDARTLKGAETPVASGDTVIILPAMAGGACASRG